MDVVTDAAREISPGARVGRGGSGAPLSRQACVFPERLLHVGSRARNVMGARSVEQRPPKMSTS